MKYSTCIYTVTLKPGLGVNQGHRNRRSDTYDFLLTCHSNHGPISYRFRENGGFSRKSQKKFPTLAYFAPPLKGFPLESGIGAWSKKTRTMGLPDGQKVLR